MASRTVRRCRICRAEKGKPHKFSCQVSSYPSYYEGKSDDSLYITAVVVDGGSSSSSSSSYDSSSGGCE
ncbi:hypothetical protein HWB39_gp49 [Streptomyces phage WRightOn]|uniref:Uncharacterized protein n=2 Tax=Manuelvirus TaxID=2842852 RepID=A0A2H4PIJ2_9CAUD|nr:hypothetical protein HWB39_gp49 [Streptomyces phage WRightOn]ATW62487.1 hypothetical protein SEA_WRIGHTON_53 [Streptomyces phage WRightOn]QNN98972.1 hypothetical protein SEA_ZEIGLE_50 [Streptomyces phage Zeigle]WNA15458.1 hypothetical protein SEA_KUMQUAT_50 [Streptomyces phage Kumquat]